MHLTEFQQTDNKLTWENAKGKKLNRRRRRKKRKRKILSTSDLRAADPTPPQKSTNKVEYEVKGSQANAKDDNGPTTPVEATTFSSSESNKDSNNFNHDNDKPPADSTCGVSSQKETGIEPSEDTVDWERVVSYRPTRNTAREKYMSQYIGKRISCRSRGSWRTGMVTSFCRANAHSEPTWIVTLTDDDNRDQIRCNETEIRLRERRWGNQAGIINMQLDLNQDSSSNHPVT